MAGVSQVVSETLGTYLEVILYGLYVTLYYQCMVVLRHKQTNLSTRNLQTAATLLLLLVTAHAIVDIVRDFEARATSDALKYYQNFADWKNILKSVLYVCTTVVSDAFLVYRSFVVWRKNVKIIIIPVLAVLADIGTGVYWCYTLSLVENNKTFAAANVSLRVWIFYVVTLVVNFLCTGLIAFKIWQIQRAVHKLGSLSTDLNYVAVIIVESGAIYSLWLILMIATYGAGTPFMFVFLNSLSPVIGIVFSAVIVRVATGVSTGDKHSGGQSTGGLTPTTAGGFPTSGLQISLHQTVQTHHDDIELENSSARRSRHYVMRRANNDLEEGMEDDENWKETSEGSFDNKPEVFPGGKAMAV